MNFEQNNNPNDGLDAVTTEAQDRYDEIIFALGVSGDKGGYYKVGYKETYDKLIQHFAEEKILILDVVKDPSNGQLRYSLDGETAQNIFELVPYTSPYPKVFISTKLPQFDKNTSAITNIDYLNTVDIKIFYYFTLPQIKGMNDGNLTSRWQ